MWYWRNFIRKNDHESLLSSNDSRVHVSFIQETKESKQNSAPSKPPKGVRPYLSYKREAMKIPCRVNTGPVERRILDLFEPEATAAWPLKLEVAESLLTVDRGKSSQVNIEVVTTSSHDIYIKGRTTLSCLHLVQSVTPLPVQLRESISNGAANQSENQGGSQWTTRRSCRQSVPRFTLPDCKL